jgi:hypothetical protein
MRFGRFKLGIGSGLQLEHWNRTVLRRLRILRTIALLLRRRVLRPTLLRRLAGLSGTLLHAAPLPLPPVSVPALRPSLRSTLPWTPGSPPSPRSPSSRRSPTLIDSWRAGSVSDRSPTHSRNAESLRIDPRALSLSSRSLRIHLVECPPDRHPTRKGAPAMRATAASRFLSLLACIALTGVLRAADETPQDRPNDMPDKAPVEAKRGAKKEMKRERRVSATPEIAAPDRPGRRDEPRDIDPKELGARLTNLRSKHEELRKKFGADHPDVQAVREQIAATERTLRDRSQSDDRRVVSTRPRAEPRPEPGSPEGRLEAAAQRIQHLRAAAGHLKAAEAHDLAGQLMEKAEAMEKEIREAKRRIAEEGSRPRDDGRRSDGVGELREEIERLRAEVRELRQQVLRRPTADPRRPAAEPPRRKESPSK